MKTKIIKISAILLFFVFILSIFAGCSTKTVIFDSGNIDSSTENENEKWVLTYEKSQFSNEFSDQSVYKECEYRYDSLGKVIYEKHTYDQMTIYTGYDYKYDDNGNVIAKSMKETTSYNPEYANYSNWIYQYDVNGNCIKETVVWLNDNSQDITEYEYDSEGNVLKEHYKKEGVYTYETTKISTLIYEAGKCMQSETVNETTDSIGTNTYYCVYQYEYDSNGNMSESRYYTDIDSMDEAKNPININGKFYKLYSTTFYTYKKLNDVATDMAAIDDNNSVTTTLEATTVQKKLSDSCDEVLCTGSYGNDYYEIVANKSEDYNGLVIEVGVIKNNEWLLEPTNNMPFVLNENGFSSNNPETGDIFYVGKGCFVSIKKYTASKYDPTIEYMYIAYNVETEKYYSTANYGWAFKNQVPLIESAQDEYMIIGYENYSGLTKFNILNKTDMTVSIIEIEKGVSYFSPISEGVFSVSIGDSNYPHYYFYDLGGNVVLDLSEYKTSDCQTVYFKNGKCEIEIINNNDTNYLLTIDKNGNVLSSKKIEN